MIYHKDTEAHYCGNIKLRYTPPKIMALFFGENEARHPRPESRVIYEKGFGIGVEVYEQGAFAISTRVIIM